MKLIDIYEKMILPPVPKKLCNLIVSALKTKFDYELNSPIYQVKNQKIKHFV